ncbi:MAG: aminotransferase class I/II-fold pyridoxal phosphate-dependent enzyme [Kiritimatiellae bacterium]|nr:aminotransferase class I/II-fold pyridoxal phosphate-dependent enzyme [Kiritimatiellia bacterium]
MMIAKSVRKLEGYVPGEQPKNRNVIKLNTNENPYPPSPKCAEVLKNFDLDDLRRYPDPDCTELKAALAKLNGTTPDRIFVGNGSDEILALAARAFVENDEAIGSLDPSYSLYKTLAAIRDVKWVGNRTDGKVALFLWTNPNAPTGTLAARDFVAKTAKSFKGVMLVDEAYADFSRDNCMALATAPGNRNVIVMRTFSKSFSLAGLRVGYCVGPKPLIEALVKVKDSYNVDAIAQKVALAAVKDVKWMRANVKKVVATRTKVAEAMRLRGWTVNESESNFLFARPPAGIEAESVFRELRRRNIFVRWWGIKNVRDFIRVTIGTDGQMQAFLRELERIRRR